MNAQSTFAWKAGAILGASGVLLGAFGSHGLSKVVKGDLKKIENWRTAVTYQLFHSAALLAIGAASVNKGAQPFSMAAKFMASGTVAFSGSIYLLTLSHQTFRFLFPITPLGGLSLAAGWFALLF